ncbi:DUF1489 family protein [Prosthecomicrobium pneumaticum]|uniref:Lysophospholipase n=1 Tax=Prosthecomicrobium pneumaticum TaxID=81895 RepID=A0A7W9FNY9_9HYPH|nr:DUF1489 domain-containing protein [Prosthecomicrobium pneumaticum]MBB5754169.1 hypothetical protein [Prosthecomicrobium pneumaticum]
MTLHLIKLCVGVDSVEELAAWIEEDLARQRGAGLVPEDSHTTRMTPKRTEALLDGGSLYWVIRGQVLVRQRLLALEAVTGADGIGRCKLVLEPVLVRTVPQPRQPFQGWRYLEPKDAPADLGARTAGADDLPDALRAELAAIGLF